MENFLSFIGFLSVLFQCSMLTVLTLHIRSKNPVIADFTEAKRNRQDAKKKCCILIIVGIRYTEKCLEVFFNCSKLCELGVIDGVAYHHSRYINPGIILQILLECKDEIMTRCKK